MADQKRFDVEITFIQKGIIAENPLDAFYVMMSNIEYKEYVKAKELSIKESNS